MTTSAKVITVLIVLFLSCNQTTHSTNVPSNFKIPPELTVVSHDPEKDEILKLSYKNEMQIIVSNNMSKIIKKSALFGSAMMKQSFEVRFPMVLKQTEGYNASDQDHFMVGSNIYLYRSFDYELDDSQGYMEYGALYIEEPEEYYEFYITGQRSMQETHKVIIKSFLEGIK